MQAAWFPDVADAEITAVPDLVTWLSEGASAHTHCCVGDLVAGGRCWLSAGASHIHIPAPVSNWALLYTLVLVQLLDTMARNPFTWL
jgi:hypothetical protein